MTDPAHYARRTSAPDRTTELLSTYGIEAQDLERIETYGKLVVKKLDAYIEMFYTWLARQPDFDRFFSDPAKLEHVKTLQLTYWEEFFRGTRR